MRKKNKLYTANKWNQPLFMTSRENLDAHPKNLFALGDQMEQEEPTVTGGLAIPGGLMSGVGLSSITPKITGTITGLGEGIKGLGLENNNFNFGNAALGAASGVATALSPMINKWITNGYETNGVGQTISTVGNALGDAAGAIPVFGKFLAPGVKLMSGVFGGIYNRAFGIKENAENIAAVKNNTAVAQNAAAGFNSAATTNNVLDLSRNMTSSLGLSGDDLYKGGLAKSAKRKAGRKSNRITNLENAGLAMQGVGLATGADNVMNNQYDIVMSKSFADGGYLPFDMISTPNMGAIDYGLKYDYLNMKNNQINAKNSNNIFAIGGEEDVWAGVPNRDLPPSVLLSRLEARRKAALKPVPVPGVFGGGEFGGSGTTGRITEGRIPYEEEQRDTLWVPYTQTFEDAFRNARQQGLAEFTFDGKRYNTEMGDNPDNNAAARSRTMTDLLPLVLDRKSKKYKRVGLKAFGGDLATNASDFATGLVHIETGGRHEENPYEGIQVGVDSEGVPNLVEEGETIFNDYVYSNRINIDDTTKKKFHIGKKREMTYAELSKKLEQEVSERPNDPISQASLKVQMQQLADEQERQKQEMEAERARVAFESLSDEEKVALMQQVAQQEQAQAEMTAQPTEEEMMAQEQMAQQMSPEEMAMMQQQQGQMMQAPTADAMAQPMMAYGGKVNRFDKGGDIKKKIFEVLGLHTQSDFDRWAKENNIEISDWESALDNENLRKALGKDNPALADALNRGYDFGIYIPGTNGDVTFDNDRGNWDAQTVQGWWGSEDPAWQEVIKNHPELTQNTNLTKEQLADYLRNTEAFKRGTKWLEDSENNRLAYLRGIINNPNAPKDARNYALKYIDESGNWKNNTARDYKTIFDNPSGRAANPGTYWKTPLEAVRDNVTHNWVMNRDGEWEEVIGDVPEDWILDGEYAWQDPRTDISSNYYRRPIHTVEGDGDYLPDDQSKWEGVGKEIRREKLPNGDTIIYHSPAELEGAIDETSENNNGKGRPPKHEWEGWRYAGLFGPITGLGLMAAGIGKPDYNILNGVLDKFEESGAKLADYQRIGNYLVYRPMDIWAEQNRLNANARATDRAIQNNAGPLGTQMAGLLANNYNNQIGSGNLYRQALEYNDNLRKQVADFNRATDMFNAQAYNQTSQTNAGIRNQDRAMRAQLALDAARTKMDADAGWYNGIYGNIGGLFEGISELGRENDQRNWLSDLAADGVYGNLGNSYTSDNWLKRKKEKKNKVAKGGKLNKRNKNLI